MIERLIYVAGPLFSSGDLIQNVYNATREGLMLEALALDLGVCVHAFVPHTSVLTQQLVAPRSHADAQAWDDAILRRCDALYRLPGVSAGSTHEVTLAQELNIPVFYTHKTFAYWIKDLVKNEVQS